MDTFSSTTQLLEELKQCARTKSLEHGKLLHSNVIARCHQSVYVTNTLISMYSKCGCLLQAQCVFDNMMQPTVVSWNVLISGYVENGEGLLALHIFNTMDCTPNHLTFVSVLKACTCFATDKESCLRKGIEVHEKLKQFGLENAVQVSTSLVTMYGKCNDMFRARDVFDRSLKKDVISWTALIVGYMENGQNNTALGVFRRMDTQPNAFTLAAVLKAVSCTDMLDKETCLKNGMSLHQLARKLGIHTDLAVSNTLVDMYMKFGDISKALRVFNEMNSRDILSWNVLILGYVGNGRYSDAVTSFDSMDCAADRVTFIGALKACVGLAAEDRKTALKKGIEIHKRAKQLAADDIALSSSLIDMYCKCGDMSSARRVFEEMKVEDSVSAAALIGGYSDNGQSSEALNVFKQLSCAPSPSVFVAVMKACCSLVDLETGREIHRSVCRFGWEHDRVLSTTLVDLYGKCGKVDLGQEVFNAMQSSDVVSWTALIGGYSLIGDSSQVFMLAERMQDYGLELNDVTVQHILAACSHAGVVERGQGYLESMMKCGFRPSLEHYGCVVDMLGRANKLEEALSVVEKLPPASSRVVWMALLGACRKWSNVKVGKVAFDALESLQGNENCTEAAYVLMRNIYSSLGMNQDVDKIEDRRKNLFGTPNY